MDHSRFHITSKQLIFIIIGTQISAGVLSLPRLVAGEAAQHAWISVLVGAVPSFSYSPYATCIAASMTLTLLMSVSVFLTLPG